MFCVFVLFLYIACGGVYLVVVCSVLFGPVFVRPVHPLCYQAFEISVYNNLHL